MEQEGVKWKQLESNIFQITVPTRFVDSPGAYKCIADGDSTENTKACQLFEPQYQEQKEIHQGSVYDDYPDDTGKLKPATYIMFQ